MFRYENWPEEGVFGNVFKPACRTGTFLSTPGVTTKWIWFLEITYKYAVRPTFWGACVWIFDQCLIYNPLLNDLTIERPIDLVSPPCKGSRAWCAVKHSIVCLGKIVPPILNMAPLSFHNLQCLCCFISGSGFCFHSWGREASDVRSYVTCFAALIMITKELCAKIEKKKKNITH